MDGAKFNADVPLQAVGEDKLAFEPYAKKLAKMLHRTKVPEGYVVGLHGAWGSGKSTLLNFVVHEIEQLNAASKTDQDRLILIRFEPWLHSGHQDLIAAFFKILAERLPRLSAQPSRSTRWLRGLGKRVGHPLIDAVAAVGATIDPNFGIGTKAVASAGKLSLSDRIQAWNETPSLQSAYEALVQGLKDERQRFLVIIDDVDRLTGCEIREMMQLVKSVGRLPYVTYLLAYDRRIVWAALDEGNGPPGSPSFAEKIVQQELELPRPQQSDLFGIIDSVAVDAFSAFESGERFHRIVIHGLANWIHTPRDAVRLGNAVNFAWQAVTNEIDPCDLIAIEGMRLFDYETFRWVHENRLLLVDESAFLIEEERKLIARRLRDRLETAGRKFLVEVLSVLFPNRAKELAGTSDYRSEPHYLVASRLGIGCEQGYDTYFSLHPPEGEVPKSTIDQLFSRLNDQSNIERVLRNTGGRSDRKGEPLVGSLLRAVHFRLLANEEVDPSRELLHALMRTGDEIVGLQWTGRWFASPPHQVLAGIFRQMVKRWGQDKAAEEFGDVMKESSALMASFLLVRVLPELAAHGADPEGLLREENVESLMPIVAEQTRQEIAADKLHLTPVLWPILAVWERFAEEGEIKTWLIRTLRNHPALLGKLPLFSTTSSSAGIEYTLNNNISESIYDMSALFAAAKLLLSDAEALPDLRDKAKTVLKAVDRD